MAHHADAADETLQESLLGDDRADTGDEVSAETTKVELKALLKLSAPLMVQLSSQYAIIIVNQYFIGHLGPAPLAAAAIGNTWFNFCWYFLLGVSTALDTLGSHSHGEGNPNGVISCCVSAISVLSLLCIPVSVAMLTASTVAQKVFFQTPEAGQLVGVFCKALLPGLLPLVWSIAVLKAMQVQNHVWAPAIMTVITAVLNVPINMVLVHYYDFWGAALATSVTRTLLLVLLCGWLLWLSKNGANTTEQDIKTQKKDPKSEVTYASAMAAVRHGVSPKVMTRFLALGLPGGVMMGVDAASFDVTTVMASVLGEAQVDAHSILLTFCVFIYMSFPFGVSTAATIRVGNLVGANRPSEAKLAGYVAVALGCSFTTLEAAGILIFKNRIGPLFVDDARVSREVASVAPICAGYQVTDGIYGVASGVLRGLGRQASLMWFNIIGFWVVGFTTGYLLTFKANFGLAGIWWGIFWGISVTAALCAISMLRVDWQGEADKARSESLAIQAAHRLEQQPVLVSDLERALSADSDGEQTQASMPGVIPQEPAAATSPVTMSRSQSRSQDLSPRISIQPFGTPGQRHFVGSFGSQSPFPEAISKAFGSHH
ncbi:hypothetical protein WJX82_001696 [Trebouxia sp. C0006]